MRLHRWRAKNNENTRNDVGQLSQARHMTTHACAYRWVTTKHMSVSMSNKQRKATDRRDRNQSKRKEIETTCACVRVCSTTCTQAKNGMLYKSRDRRRRANMGRSAYCRRLPTTSISNALSSPSMPLRPTLSSVPAFPRSPPPSNKNLRSPHGPVLLLLPHSKRNALSSRAIMKRIHLLSMVVLKPTDP